MYFKTLYTIINLRLDMVVALYQTVRFESCNLVIIGAVPLCRVVRCTLHYYGLINI